MSVCVGGCVGACRLVCRRVYMGCWGVCRMEVLENKIGTVI